MNYILESDIVDEIIICAYCGSERRNPVAGCCGEVHYDEVYVTRDGETYPIDYTKVVDSIDQLPKEEV